MSIIAKNLNLPSTDIGNVTSATQFNDADGDLLTLAVPVSAQYMNRPIRVRAGGRCSSGSATTFTAKLYYGNSSTIATNTEAGAVAVTTTASSLQAWEVDIFVMVREQNPGDAGSITTSFVSAAGVIGTSESVSDPTLANVAFSLTGIFAASDSANSATVDFFQLEAD